VRHPHASEEESAKSRSGWPGQLGDSVWMTAHSEVIRLISKQGALSG
jgi:hypothetical protein